MSGGLKFEIEHSGIAQIGVLSVQGSISMRRTGGCPHCLIYWMNGMILATQKTSHSVPIIEPGGSARVAISGGLSYTVVCCTGGDVLSVSDKSP